MIVVVLGVGGAIVLSIRFAMQYTKPAAIAEREATYPDLLDELFNGDEFVTYGTNVFSMPFDVVVVGAKERGYKLFERTSINRSGDETLIFEKEASD